MANFCAACGEALQPDNRFCPNCGRPVPVSSDPDVRIRPDGNGGLVIEAPEGSTVTVSDNPPKR